MIPKPIYYKTKTRFLTDNSDYLTSDCPYYNNIVYIEDTEEIYTHGKIFGDKGIELNLFDLASGNTTTIQENYQKIKSKYDEDPDNPVVAHIYYEQDGKKHRLDKQILLFQRIDLTDSFTALLFNVDSSSDNVEVTYYSISSEGEFTTGSKTIVTSDKLPSDVGASDTPIYFNGGVPHEVTGIASNLLTVLSSDYYKSAGMSNFGALISKQPVNILAGATINEVKFERWSGAKGNSATWEDFTTTESSAVESIFAGVNLQGNANQKVAYNGTTGVVGDKVRYTISPSNRYCSPHFFYTYFNGEGGIFKLTLEYNTWNVTNNVANDDWTILHENVPLATWSGTNEYSMTKLGVWGQTNNSSGYGLRVTIECVEVDNTYSCSGNIRTLQLFTRHTPWASAADYSTNNLKILGVPYYTRDNRNIVLDRGLESKNDIIPFTSETYNLGDVDHKWDTIYANNFTGKADSAINAEKALHAETAVDLSGHTEATSEQFTYRTSAGQKSIKDDNAFIRKIKGNSVVFNQLGKDEWALQQATGTINNREYTLTSMTGSFPGIWCNKEISTPIGHKVLVSVYTRQEGVSAQQFRVNFQGTNVNFQYNESVPDGLVYRGAIFEVAHTNTTNCTLFCMTNIPTLIQYKDPQIFDLTQMFGVGNEPTTVEEFRALYPNSYYPYNTGEFRNLNCHGIKTIGFNEFNGSYARVLPNETYYLGGEYTSVAFATELGGATETIQLSSERLYTPTQLGYIYASGTNININLHHTGYRDGEYESYKEVTHSLPLLEITNGEPLRKAGSVYDEVNETEYIKRVGTVDLGSLEWDYTSSTNFFACYNLSDMKVTATNDERLDGLFCSKYPLDTNSTISTQATNKSIKRNAGVLYIRDTSFTSAAAFKAAMSGIILNYELAEPIVTPIESPIDFNYYVEDFGTEEALLTEDSAPFSADIVYQFNAVDRIRQNNLNIDRLEEKVLTLPSEFKTINGNSIIGSGDLTITTGNVGTEDDNDGVDDVNTQTYLRYVEQSLTDDQKTQARTNIGAASISDLNSKQNNIDDIDDIRSNANLGATAIQSVKTINGASIVGSGDIIVAPAYAEYTGTSTAVVVTTKYGYFPTTLVEGARVSVKFEGVLTSISSLNVNGTGVKNVYYKGSSLTSGMINQYNTYEFIYDGTYYRIIGVNTDTDTHYTAKNIVGAGTTAKANAAATGSVYLNLIENSTVRSTHSITGSNNISVSSNASGNITISGPELKTINGTSIIGAGNINAGNITVASGTADTTTLQHNTMLTWTEVGDTTAMLLEFPTGTGSALNCGFFLELTPDAAADFSVSFDGEIHWANDTAPELEQEYAYEMWFTSYNNGSSWLGVFTKYTM